MTFAQRWTGRFSTAFVIAVTTASAVAVPPNQTWTTQQRRQDDPRRTATQQATTRQDTDARRVPPSWQRQSGNGLVRLSYVVATPWERVLRSLAKETKSELVMAKVPPGRFVHRKTDEYTRSQAVRVLNSELEKVGYRILESDSHLVVLHLRELRAEYDRPDYQRARRVRQVTPASAATTAPAQQPIPMAPVQTTPQPLPTGVNVATPVPPAAASALKKEAIWVDSITLKSVKAVDVARQMYLAFPNRNAIVQKGPEGLPAFDVFEDATKSSREFRIGIDQKGNRLVMEASPTRTASLRKMISTLDHAPRPNQQSKVIAAKDSTQALATQLKPVFRQLAYQDKTPPGQEPQVDTNAMGQGLDEALTGALKGEVNIQNVPGVGLVITGNEKDVERVLKVINRIESLSADATPEIRLRPLRFVNSEALSGLMTEVYEKYTALLTESVRANRQASFIPIVQPNALLILAPKGAVDGVLSLVDELDKPTDPQREFIVLQLKSAAAAQTVALLEQFYAERGGLGARARVIADARTNAIIVQAGKRDLTEITTLVQKLDRDSSATISQMRVVPLDNAIAEELAEVVNEAIQSVIQPTRTTGGGGTQGTLGQEARSAVLRLITDRNKGDNPITSGVLTRIRVTPDPGANSLIVTAPTRSMELVIALIRQLDKPATTVAEVKVFPLANADATTIVELLNTLFEEDTPGALQFGEGGGGLVPLRFSVDSRINAVVAIGSTRSLEIVEAILLRLDEDDVNQRKTEVYRLKNSPALDVANAINQYLDSQREINEADPTLSSPFAQLEREVVVVPELVSNSLIISASPRFFPEIERVINSLDAAPKQVIIQALLVEVALENLDEFGIELGFQDSILFDRSITEILETISTTTTAPTGVQTTTTNIVSQTSNPGFNFNNQPLGNNTAAGAQGRLGGQSLSNFGLGRVNSDLGFGGLVLSASSENVSLLLRALAQQRDVHILSRPQIRTLDNQLAEIQVGQQVPIVNGVNVTTLGVANPLVVQDEAGIILSVTPRINSDGIIVMEVGAEKSAFSGDGVPIFVQTDGSVISSPVKDITTARATVSVPNNQTIILGGMITERNETLTRKVPWLGDIPGVGQLFRYDSHDNRRTELLIFLTPRIIESEEMSEQINLVETERTHWWEDKAEEVHGPIFGMPQDTLFDQNGVPLPMMMPQEGVHGYEYDPTMPVVPGPIVHPQGRFVPPPAIGDGATIINGVDQRFLPSPAPPAN